MARRGLSISGLSLESKYEAIMRFLRRGYRYFALHDTIVGIRPMSAVGIEAGWGWAICAPMVIPAVAPGDHSTVPRATAIFRSIMGRSFMANGCRQRSSYTCWRAGPRV